MALTMNAGGRELLFRFTVRAWVEIEEKLGSLNRRWHGLTRRRTSRLKEGIWR